MTVAKSCKKMAPIVLVTMVILMNVPEVVLQPQQQQQQQRAPSPLEQQLVSVLHSVLKNNPPLAKQLQGLLLAAEQYPDNMTSPDSASGNATNPMIALVLQGIQTLYNTQGSANTTKGAASPAVNANLFQQMVQNPMIQGVIQIITEEIQKGMAVAAANNMSVGNDMSALLGLVNPMTVIQKMLTSQSASTLLPNQPNQLINAACYRDVIDTFDSIPVGKGWAIQMLDAAGKPIPGIEEGAFHFVGAYDQCYAIKPSVEKGDILGTRVISTARQFGTRYCRADIAIPEQFIKSLNVDTKGVHIKITQGLCVPDSCHAPDLRALFKTGVLSKLNLSFENMYCNDDNDLSKDTSAIVAIAVLSFFLLLIVSGTIYDIYKSDQDKHETTTQNKTTTNGLSNGTKVTNLNGVSNEAYEKTDLENIDIQLPKDYMPHREGDVKVQYKQIYPNLNGATGKGTNNGLTSVESPNDKKRSKRQAARAHANFLPVQIQPEGQTERKPTDGRESLETEPLLARIILCFSLYTNIPKMLHAKSAPGSISCVHGIRFISMTWVVLGHTYNYGIISQTETFTAGNLLDFVPIMQRFTYQAVIAGGFSVDTFFVLSAFLLTWLQLKATSKSKQKLTVSQAIMFYFHRFWRLTPIYMLVMMTFTCLYQYMGSGPMWPSKIWVAEHCKDNWWTNMLYVNNLVNVDSQCMGWTWYLANDMQFYVISPIFLIAMYISTVYGGILTSVLMATGVGIAFWKEYVYNGNFFTMKSDGGDYWQQVYTVPWCRVSCWTVGMLLGLLLYKRDKKPIPHKALVRLGWFIATAVALFLVYIPHTENKEDGVEWTRVERAFYESVGRPAWGMCVAWVVYACYTGSGGLVNSFLSWNGFIPLSRLTYAAYLVHPICMMVYVFSRRTLFFVNDYNIVYLYFGHLCMTYMVAFVCSLAFEAPFMGLEKILFRKGR